MNEKLEERIIGILKLLADPTRRYILSLISNDPLNPQEIADKLEISRPAIEKHLKLLRENYLCDRARELFPEPHYEYYATIPALELINIINMSTRQFFQSMDGIISAEIEQLERDFVLGRINRAEYDTKKPLLIKKQKELEELQLTRIWLEEAKKMVDEHNHTIRD